MSIRLGGAQGRQADKCLAGEGSIVKESYLWVQLHRMTFSYRLPQIQSEQVI